MQVSDEGIGNRCCHGDLETREGQLRKSPRAMRGNREKIKLSNGYFGYIKAIKANKKSCGLFLSSFP